MRKKYNREKFVNVGFLKIEKDVIIYANRTALTLLQGPETIIGKTIDTIFCEFELARTHDQPLATVAGYNNKNYFIITNLYLAFTNYYEIYFFPADQMGRDLDRKTLSEATFDSILPILDSLHDHVLVTDGKGIILKAHELFEELCGVTADEIVGTSVYDAERKGLFRPSTVAIALKTKKKVTVLQKTFSGARFLVNAVPFFDDNNQIIRVLTYSSTMDELANIKDLYKEMHDLENKMERYSLEIKEIREKEVVFPEIVAESSKTKNLIELSVKLAKVDINLLITGESGVGKNVFAKLIHQQSLRKDGPFIEINCGAIPETLLESELFGYKPGAFTGALREGKLGLIALAQNGTLFLDEIGELPLNLQVKILKVIHEKELTQIGSTESKKIDCRIIAATNKDLQKEVQDGNFREDLYYRLNVVPIQIHPLRERTEDILAFIDLFLEKANEKYGKQKFFSSDAIDAMLRYKWPGNVRELKNIIERMVITVEEERIDASILPQDLKSFSPSMIYEGQSLKQMREGIEKDIITNAYEKFKTTVGVAKHLKITQATASRKIRKYYKSMQ
ncbi:MAG TPA: sigma 54-interacting transcriptional regulator [Syntrophales bacterium]|nr:sigma 54-interacting transcriptional regulator [Syntrophales bacterium]